MDMPNISRIALIISAILLVIFWGVEGFYVDYCGLRVAEHYQCAVSGIGRHGEKMMHRLASGL